MSEALKGPENSNGYPETAAAIVPPVISNRNCLKTVGSLRKSCDYSIQV